MGKLAAAIFFLAVVLYYMPVLFLILCLLLLALFGILVAVAVRRITRARDKEQKRSAPAPPGN